MISLSSVTFGWERPLFADLSLDVPSGSLCAVVGPNGAGKSTLLRLVLGLLTPSSGRVLVDGVALRELPQREVARRVAALLQDEPLVFPMTALECVLLGRVAHLPGHGFETAADLDAARVAMDEVEVTSLAQRLLETLSGGERRRVLLARALAQGAPVLVLDEPSANLDLSHELELFSILRRRADAGATVLVSVHDLNLAARSCDRVIVIDGRGGVSMGTPSEALTKERIADVFRVDVELAQIGGAPYFVPLRVTR